jgi:hypothetical protein
MYQASRVRWCRFHVKVAPSGVYTSVFGSRQYGRTFHYVSRYIYGQLILEAVGMLWSMSTLTAKPIQQTKPNPVQHTFADNRFERSLTKLKFDGRGLTEAPASQAQMIRPPKSY